MSLMRHTDLRLTMRTYTDPRTFDLAGAVEKLPSMTKPTEPQAARATGTDGRDEADSGRTFCVTYPSAGLGSRSAVIGGHDDDGGRTVSVGTGGNWQQKTPSGEKGVNVRAIGVEPTAYPPDSAEKQRIVPPGAPKASPTVCPPVPADPDSAAILKALAGLTPQDRQSIVAHVQALVRLSPGRRQAIMTLTRPLE
jgi:hypothetical protein